jgi:hypothetical protein
MIDLLDAGGFLGSPYDFVGLLPRYKEGVTGGPVDPPVSRRVSIYSRSTK